MDMIFRQLNPNACRTYLVGAKGSSGIVLIDPVLEHVAEYLELLDREQLRLTQVIDTHTHADHISGGAALIDLAGCEYLMHSSAPSQCVTSRLKDGFEFQIGSIPIKVMDTPGHSKDSISLIFPDRILTGDVLFLDDGGAGRDDLPGGNAEEHWDSLQRILGLPDHLVVYPAHDYRDRQPSSLGEQKKYNPHLKPQTKSEYVEYVGELMLGPADWMKDIVQANYACARDPAAAWVPLDAAACEVLGTLDQGANDQQVEEISADELKRLLDGGRAPVLLDVRESEELHGALGHLPGINHLPIGALSKHLSDLERQKDQQIVTICRTGGRSHTAAQILMQAGFDQVHSLRGGMRAWKQAGHPIDY